MNMTCTEGSHLHPILHSIKLVHIILKALKKPSRICITNQYAYSYPQDRLCAKYFIECNTAIFS